VLATVHEITEKIVGERRIMALRDLGTRATNAKTAEEGCAIAAEALAKHAKDVPFSLIYLVDPDRQRARLAGSAGVVAGGAASPPVIDLNDESDHLAWPLAAAMRTGTQTIEDLARRFGDAVPPGPWADPPRQAVVVPIRSNVPHELAGFLVAGISLARRRADIRQKPKRRGPPARFPPGRGARNSAEHYQCCENFFRSATVQTLAAFEVEYTGYLPLL
jgi:hypothetical protein